jgi:hypothetical protein
MICLAVTNSVTGPYPGKAWSVWQPRTVPLVPIVAKHNLSGSHELWHWSLSWKIMMSRGLEVCNWSLIWQSMIRLAVTKSAIGPYSGKSSCLAVTKSATGPYPGKLWSVSQSRTLPLVPTLAKHDVPGEHEFCHGNPIIGEYGLTDVYGLLLVPLVGKETRHWLQSRHRMIWGSRNLPLVHIVAEHMTVTGCYWSQVAQHSLINVYE